MIDSRLRGATRPLRLVAAGVVALAAAGAAVPPAPAATSTLSPVVGTSPRSDVDRLLSRMSLADKVGQLLVPRVYGTDAVSPDSSSRWRNETELGAPSAAEIVREFHVGGLLYFSPTTNDASRLARFNNAVQTAAGSGPGILTMLDQEHGRVLRVTEATQFPTQMAVGATHDPAMARLVGTVTGKELRAIGIYANLAPVADVNSDPRNPVIGDRSFGSYPGLVSRMVAAEITGLHDAGVAAAAKHFPGHGATSTDSHTSLPIVGHSRTELERFDLPPFRAAIAAGVDMILTAHVMVPAIDNQPATLSHAILTGLLREELGFDGVIITDSLRMAGVRTTVDDSRIPVLALKAGADMLLDPADLPGARDSILAAIASGELTESRIDDSVRRILTLKAARGLLNASALTVKVKRVDGALRTASALDAAARVADASITEVRDQKNLVPVGAVSSERIAVVGYSQTAVTALARALRDRGAEVTTVVTGSDPTSSTTLMRQRADQSDLVIVLSPGFGSGWPTLVTSLLAGRTPVIVAGTSIPYEVTRMPLSTTYLAAYSMRPASMHALARVIEGRRQAIGRLPVTLS